jgi:mannose-6-phosphate isomerase-like protein (cupin superfamily)
MNPAIDPAYRGSKSAPTSYSITATKNIMEYTLPHTIRNCKGEVLIFQRIEKTPEGDMLIGENFVQPGSGPLMHTHYKQDEGLTVISGRLGYQVAGREPAFANPGESVTFPRGVAHRFWAEGTEVLNCKAWIRPANTIVFFLSSIFAAQNKSGTERPEMFDAAYLLTRYKAEYSVSGIPLFVRKVIVPITYFFGKMLGKYDHFKDAPAPIKD